MSAAITKREALTFCRDVLKMSESVLKMSDKKAFLNEYAMRYTKRIPFTSAFDNYFLNKSGISWLNMIKDPSLLHLTGLPWITGLLSGKHGSSCAIAATFTQLLLSSLGIKSEIVPSKVVLFPLVTVHNLVVAQDENDQKIVVDLGNRLTPLPCALSLNFNDQNKPLEAGDTYTKLVQTGQRSFQRWVGYELDSNSQMKNPKLFCEFNLDDSISMFRESSMTIDKTFLIPFLIRWNSPADLVLTYWTYNVPICGFDLHDDRVVRITNRTFEVQREPKIGSKFDEFKVTSFDQYCKHTFQHFPYFENEDFLWVMSKFWKMKYAHLS